MPNNLPFPYFPARSTAVLYSNFDPDVYTPSTKSTLYYFLDALAGTSGAGSLVNQVFLSNLSGALDTCYFNELDYIVGNIKFLARTTAESYTYNPAADMLTSDQWDEVRTKDAWFRARIKDFFAACQSGGTPEGVKKCVSAAIAADCTIQEVWRYVDGFNLTEDLGRANSAANFYYSALNLNTGFEVFFSGGSALTEANAFISGQPNPSGWERRSNRPRNEVVVKPHKQDLSPAEMRLLRELLNRLMPVETLVTVDVNGLSAATPVPVAGAASDSTYYEVIKQVVPSPLIAQLPSADQLAIDLLPGEQWLINPPPANVKPWRPGFAYVAGDYVKNVGNVYACKVGGTSRLFMGPKGKGLDIADGTSLTWAYVEPASALPSSFSSMLNANKKNPKAVEAPSAAFLQSAQNSYYYLSGGGKSSPIDSVTYGTLNSDGSVSSALNYSVYQENSTYTGWSAYELADSPDNYPGGKSGQHPGYAPAVNPDGTPYLFPYNSQEEYVTQMITKITAMGGIADSHHYQLPIQKIQTAVYTYYPDDAIANFPPAKESTISTSLTRHRSRTISNNVGSPNNFVR